MTKTIEQNINKTEGLKNPGLEDRTAKSTKNW